MLTKKGEPRKMANPTKIDPRPALRGSRTSPTLWTGTPNASCCLALAEFLIPALEMGRSFALRWEEAKGREGYLDFDDLIRKAAQLLANSEAADWIRFKLDRSFDHILIDEAQDTNAQQWKIIDALIDDFFSGEGARANKIRTIFTVGDYKQAIFGFQGTSPDNFERAKEKVKQRIEAASANAHEIRSNRRAPTWEELDLGLSYRTSPDMLEFVNRAIEAIGSEALGLEGQGKPAFIGVPEPGRAA